MERRGDESQSTDDRQNGRSKKWSLRQEDGSWSIGRIGLVVSVVALFASIVIPIVLHVLSSRQSEEDKKDVIKAIEAGGSGREFEATVDLTPEGGTESGRSADVGETPSTPAVATSQPPASTAPTSSTTLAPATHTAGEAPTTTSTTTTTTSTTSTAPPTRVDDESVVEVARGRPGPTELPEEYGIPCGVNSPECRHLHIELRNFDPGTFTAACVHDGWQGSESKTWWTFSITVGESGRVAGNTPCFINFDKLTGRGVRLVVSRDGTEIARSEWQP